MTNPVLSQTPYPLFDTITLDDIAQAEKLAYEAMDAKLKSIVEERVFPSFDNTVKPLDTLFQEIERISMLISLYENNKTDEDVEAFIEDQEKRMSAFVKKVYQHPVLSQRFLEVYDFQKDFDRGNVVPDEKGDGKEFDLDEEDRWFLEVQYKEFEGEGAFLEPDAQTQLTQIDDDLIGLSKKFLNNVRVSRKENAFLVKDEAELAGLPSDVISGMKEAAEQQGLSGWLFTPERLLVDNMLEVASHRGFRQKMHESMATIARDGAHSNEGVIKRMHALREQRAHLLGYENHAEYHLSRTMAENSQNVEHLLDDSSAQLVPAFERDLQILQSWVIENGGPHDLKPWDLAYYTAEYKKAHFDFDGAALSEYLEMENVLKGWMDHIQRSFGVTFVEDPSIPTWDEAVRAYRVKNYHTEEESILYIDAFARPDEKIGGAWKSTIQLPNSEKGHVMCVVYCMNLIKPSTPDQAVTMTKDQVDTLYHEGGHALNQILGTQTQYQSRYGVMGSSDFYEIHSMIQEQWPFQREVLDTYAFHKETGEIVPQDLIERMEGSAQFMAAALWLRTVQNSWWDLGYHTISHEAYTNTADIEGHFTVDCQGIDLVRPYPLNRFDHMFFDGMSSYAAGYYGYFWSEVSQATAFRMFQANGLYHPESLEKLRTFYAQGSSRDQAAMFEALCGQKAGDPKAKLEDLGIVTNNKSMEGPKPPRPC